MENLPAIAIGLVGDAIPAAALAVDRDYRLIFLNRGAGEMFGLTAKETLGRSLGEVVGDTAWLAPVLERGATVAGSEVAIPWHGQIVRATVDAVPLAADDGRAGGAFVVLRDRAAQQETERRIQQLEILAGIGELAAGTVHEIRNPLTSISGFIQLLKARAARQDDQTSVEYCGLIAEEIGHINNILSDFLSLAKPQDSRFTRVNVIQLIGDLLNLLYGEAILSQITIIPRLPPGPLWVCGNGEKIKEVLLNLCRNAFQAMAGGGTLTVTAGADAERVRVAVGDSGPGVPETLTALIFKPFFTTKEDGTGLGLAICRRIMESHGGEIAVASVAGEGSTFTLTFPRLKGPE